MNSIVRKGKTSRTPPPGETGGKVRGCQVIFSTAAIFPAVKEYGILRFLRVAVLLAEEPATIEEEEGSECFLRQQRGRSR